MHAGRRLTEDEDERFPRPWAIAWKTAELTRAKAGCALSSSRSSAGSTEQARHVLDATSERELAPDSHRRAALPRPGMAHADAGSEWARRPSATIGHHLSHHPTPATAAHVPGRPSPFRAPPQTPSVGPRYIMDMQTWGPGRGSPGSRGGNQHERQNTWPPYPPPTETELEKALRVEEEREAKRISDAIDRELEAERQALRRDRKGKMKLLLLGKSPPLPSPPF
ncbi:hypothetical protein C8Q79DRAFT_1010079 [Trametes meyenii]|nr:hypothetical protein C8Q79DRAFT_1010079 [Trametes meyenii]